MVDHEDDLTDPLRAAPDLVARMRRLTGPTMSADLMLRLRLAARRREVLRPDPERVAMARRRALTQVWQVLAVAATVLGAALLGQTLAANWLQRADDSARAQALASVPAPALQGLKAAEFGDAPLDVVPLEPQVEPGFLARLDALVAQPGAVTALGWLDARNGLEQLRAEFRQRFSAEGRRAVLVATGAAVGREDRIQELAEVVAARLDGMLAGARDGAAEQPGQHEQAAAPVGPLALGVRALLAAGSTRVLGPHRAIVRRAAEELQERLAAGLPDEVATTVLAAVMDLAVVSGGRAEDLVREHAARLAAATVSLHGERRPPLLHWQTPLASLADAGYVLRLAPAFGAPAPLCARARRLVLKHLHERLDGTTERPEVLAAMLYGFGDLVDQAAVDQRLALWSPRLLLPDYLALLHYAWGQYPLREGWADFQSDLRYLAALPVPAVLDEAAALLMTLATNFAAPGSLSLFARG